MSNILLSILIPTTVCRRSIVCHLLSEISRQIEHYDLQYEVEVITQEDEKEMSIGEKRNQLYAKANGVFSWQIDSDDTIPIDAIKTIITAIKENPTVDCITFKERCVINGRIFTCNHSIAYNKWDNNIDGYDYVRTPYFKDCIKTELCQKVKVPFIRFNEDEQFSILIKALLKTEHHIPKELYNYIYNHTEFNIRYGITK